MLVVKLELVVAEVVKLNGVSTLFEMKPMVETLPRIKPTEMLLPSYFDSSRFRQRLNIGIIPHFLWVTTKFGHTEDCPIRLWSISCRYNILSLQFGISQV